MSAMCVTTAVCRAAVARGPEAGREALDDVRLVESVEHERSVAWTGSVGSTLVPTRAFSSRRSLTSSSGWVA